jgi:hypothetical protein
MRPNKPSKLGDLKIRGLCPANPLWPLAELGDLSKPRFIADPGFTSFDLTALCRDDRRASASLPSKDQAFQSASSIPRLVMGLPWRFAKNTTTPVLPDPDFAPFELGYIARR